MGGGEERRGESGEREQVGKERNEDKEQLESLMGFGLHVSHLIKGEGTLFASYFLRVLRFTEIIHNYHFILQPEESDV